MIGSDRLTIFSYMHITERQLRRLIYEELAIGLHGAGMDSADLRQRLGYGGIALKKDGRVTKSEADHLANQIAQKKPDKIFAYSRGCAAFNEALMDGDMPANLPPVVYVAPAFFRGWSDDNIQSLPAGSIVMIGAKDRNVSLVQASHVAKITGATLWVNFKYSHRSILYSRGKLDEFTQVRPEDISVENGFPNWRTGVATLQDLDQQLQALQKLLSPRMDEVAVRQIIRDVLAEDLQSFVKRTTGAGEFKGNMNDPTFEEFPSEKKKARNAKRIWSDEADHSFFDSLIKVHWFQHSPLAGLDWILTSSGKDEISTMLYLPGSEITSSWANVGVVVQGHVTIAANSMDSLVSGYKSRKDLAGKYAASGVPKRPTRMTRKQTSNYILDRDSFKETSQGHNEGIVDNWKPVALVLPWGGHALRKKALEAGLKIIGKNGKEL